MNLQDLISIAFGDGSISNIEGQRILDVAMQQGATADDIARLSASAGFPLPGGGAEVQDFIGALGLNGTLPTTSTFGQPTQTSTPGQPTQPGVPAQGPYNQPQFTLPTIEALGNTFADNFGNAPGNLGFNDLNPIVTSAENTQQTAIPEFLKPSLALGADAMMGSQASLTELLARDNALTSPFNDLQNQALQMALEVGTGTGGFVPQAQGVFQEIADGTDIADLYSRGENLLQSTDQVNQLGQRAGGTSGNSTAMNTLESTAAGDFLYGNPAFDEAVQASIRAARPGLINTFSAGGSGAINGGLAQIGMQQAASDAFARQFANERSNMLNASNSLNAFGLNDTGMQLNALNSAIRANQNAGQAMFNVANADRSRQLQAAQLLPQMGLLNSQIVGSVGDRFQGEEERQKQGQIQAMERLLNNAFGTINPNALFGNISSVQESRNRGAGALGGALTGARIGSMIPGVGTGFGAIAGGLLGGFG